jgi:hypothetical protein
MNDQTQARLRLSPMKDGSEELMDDEELEESIEAGTLADSATNPYAADAMTLADMFPDGAP